ncbi:MAG: isochorismate synthase [Actinomycetota bacterium]|nr:isochorismate synthase [Actinomycetota bacterium]
MSSSTVTVRIDRAGRDLDPVVVGSRSGLLWSRGDFTLAGVGEARRFRFERPDGGADVSAALAELSGPNEVGVPGTGAVAFGAFPFQPSARGELIVPEIVLGRGPEGRRWLTTFGGLNPDEALSRLSALVQRGHSTAGDEPSDYRLRSTLSPETWRDDVVAVARDRIQSGALRKAVFARELIVTTDHPIDPVVVLSRLHQSFRSSILFAVDGFIGASPELLVSRSGDVVRAHPLAGTAPRSSDPEADQGLAAGLLASAKDRGEHRITIDWLLDTLLPFCSYVDAEPEPTIVTLANVHHLGTRVEGRLSNPPTSVLDLVGALHPTPAVGGDPQGVALQLISELEQADRGRYAGPVGWVDAAGNGAFAVGIRSATIAGNTARLFAGVGVVADSDPPAELAETRAKFQALLGALIRP